MQLTELEKWYNLYKDFWSEWKGYKLNGLIEEQVYAIEAYRKSNFILNTKILEQFQDKDIIVLQLTHGLIEALRVNYPRYKRWVYLSFRSWLARQANNLHTNKFVVKPFRASPVSMEVQNVLEAFGCNSVKELTVKYTEADCMEEQVFKYLLRFSDQIIAYHKNKNLIKVELKYEVFNN